MHTPISNLYRQLLKRFNFSIGGYSNPEKEVSDFFYKLCKNELVYQNESIRVLMFGFAQLSFNDINEIDLDKWETKPLSKFNYFDYSSGYAEVLLSLYIHCLNEICNNRRATNIISENIRRDINLRVIVDKTETEFLFRENKRLEALEIIVPGKSIFNDCNQMAYINSFIDSNDSEIECFVIQDEEFEHEYKIDPDSQSKYKKCYEELALKVLKVQPKDFLAAIDTYLPSKSVQERIKHKTLRNPDANLADIIAVAYSASLFCYFFDCHVEYFVSVSNVSLNKKYSLGSLAVGVKNGEELTFDERAMFSIISNHIASNLSAQIIFENNKEIKRKSLRRELKNRYNYIKDIKPAKPLHGTEKIEDAQFKEISKFVADNEFAFSKDFNERLAHLKHENGNYISKYCLLELKENEFCGCKVNKPLHLFSKMNIVDPKCHFPIGNMLLINIPFISGIFEKLTEKKRVAFDVISDCEIKNKMIDKNQIIFDVEYTEDFPVDDFYKKLKRSHPGDLIATYFIENYSLLDAHGIFKIVDNDGKEIFNSREMINMVIDKKLILNEGHFVSDSADLKNLKLIFVNELI